MSTLGDVVSRTTQDGREEVVVDAAGNPILVAGPRIGHPGDHALRTATRAASLPVVSLGQTGAAPARPTGSVQLWGTPSGPQARSTVGVDADGRPVAFDGDWQWLRCPSHAGPVTYPVTAWTRGEPHMMSRAGQGVTQRGTARERLADARQALTRFDAQEHLSPRRAAAQRAALTQDIGSLQELVNGQEQPSW